MTNHSWESSSGLLPQSRFGVSGVHLRIPLWASHQADEPTRAGTVPWHELLGKAGPHRVTRAP